MDRLALRFKQRIGGNLVAPEVLPIPFPVADEADYDAAYAHSGRKAFLLFGQSLASTQPSTTIPQDTVSSNVFLHNNPGGNAGAWVTSLNHYWAIPFGKNLTICVSFGLNHRFMSSGVSFLCFSSNFILTSVSFDISNIVHFFMKNQFI